MYARRQQLEAEITSIKAQLAALPEGKLICSRNGTRYKWYRSDGHTKTYIPKTQLHLAKQLALKAYLNILLKNFKHEKLALDLFFRHHQPSSCMSDPFLLQNPEVQKLLSDSFKPASQKLSDWMNLPFETNPAHPEQLTHKTVSGLYVRSKSESMIVAILAQKKLPFRYECALTLDGVTLYPDFTICNPQTQEIYYWEHFGLMDHPDYCKKACSKIQLYASHGIIPSIRLITTFETKDHPLCIDTVQKLVEEYF